MTQTGYIKYLTDQEFRTIKKYIDTELRSPPKRMCLKIMLYMGLRVGEAIRLKRSNFNKDWSILTFELEKSHKIKERYVPKKLREMLKSYYLKYNWRMTDGHLFFANWGYNSKKPHLQCSTIEFMFRDLRRKLKLDQPYYIRKDGSPLYRVSSHTFRHHFVYMVYKASGHDLRITQQIIGHKKIQQTAAYINALDTQKAEASIIEKVFI